MRPVLMPLNCEGPESEMYLQRRNGPSAVSIPLNWTIVHFQHELHHAASLLVDLADLAVSARVER